ncbi:tRNA (adenosine(37)-N6)-threonylcarbamoyltransferase complex dimerization subunit type 1 TsaB [Cellulomonas aerilata]|uniref:tRNA (Adenosine(37)-N6)-threonylcarbamoyltransferase complex dimerization subunit type 1 TsaB n=1 Tax=Cellulomonas aerilata TaxID=515326 RepID=A0A512D8Z8_9CELL|nr:tRNA (adenosine(37)-N6)-threonylcarbamoyltransferase complex dimerization subunit type 1 TsaB [Cellulomonas aerilata]GEO32921.1 tRNA (adenosine(37)-N6)-threonylcarbamoyltransferase complex dimerization subunit type 1 TsaB [Cellulomonas aerilata]
MPVLALDTSAAVAVSLVTDDGVLLAARCASEDRRHAELLGPMITGVLSDAGVGRQDLTAVVAGTGPAPFTGLRVGLVTARTLALALGLPVLGVPCLDALALQAARDLHLAAGTEVLALGDARRREVYWARYRVTGSAGASADAGDPAAGPDGPDVEPLGGPGVERPAQLAADGTADGAVVVGRGATLYPDVLTVAHGAPLDPDPAVLAQLALLRRARGREQPSEPLYLRRPDVMEPAARKRASG